MKVVMVMRCYYSNPSGVSEHVHYLTRALRRLGHDVRVVTSASRLLGDDGTIRSANNIRFPINGAMVNVTLCLGLRNRLKRIFSQHRFDVIRIHWPLEPTLPLAALVVAADLECPVVGTFHMAVRISTAYEAFSGFLHHCARRLNRRIAFSTAAERFALRHFPGEYIKIPNGVEFYRFALEADPVRVLSDAKINFLYVGRLDLRKNIPWLISGFRRLHRSHPNTKLVLIGQGPMEAACRIAAYPLIGKAIIFKGMVGPYDLPSYYRSSPVFCSVPCGSESFGIVLLEAIAAGKPVVATDIEGYREIISNDVEGILIRPGDIRSLVDSVTGLVKDHEVRVPMGNKRQERSKRFDWCGVARAMDGVHTDVFYDPLIKGGNGTAGTRNIRLL
jgi:phosphatidylinositol alpha-mannosyltransferase